MFKILLATDGSVHALKAAEYVVKLCQRMADAEVTALYVKDLSLPMVGFMDGLELGVLPDGVAMQREVEEAAATALKEAEGVLERGGRPINTRSEWGQPVAVIVNTAEQEGFDLVVLGSRGHGHITGMFLGSVSDRVAHESKVPVLIVR